MSSTKRGSNALTLLQAQGSLLPMAQPVNLTITRKSTGITEQWRGEIADDEWSLLLEFLAEAERLGGTKMLREGCDVSVNVKADQAGFRITSTLPAPDDLDAFFHRMRPFVLQKERLYYNSIHSRLWKRIDFTPFHAVLEQPHRLFNGKDFRDQIKISVFQDAVDAVEKVINDEVTLDQWLNVHEYHRDDGAKRTQLDRIASAAKIEDLRGVFVSMMVDKAQAIWALSSIVRRLRDRDGIERTLSAAPLDAEGQDA